jgi:CheY-like chemotaxis protein
MPFGPTLPILIVEDVAARAKTLALLCQSPGMETHCAASVADAGAALTGVAEPVDLPTLAEFIARSGIPFQPPRQGLH